MSKQRADLGFAAELESFDPQAWTPAPARTANDRPGKEKVQEAAQASGFRSREPKEPEAAPPVRRRRTGRNTQFNIKARPETIEAFCAIADAQGWGLGETLEHAVALLEREHRRS
jgi:hypothetical protein